MGQTKNSQSLLGRFGNGFKEEIDKFCTLNEGDPLVRQRFGLSFRFLGDNPRCDHYSIVTDLHGVHELIYDPLLKFSLVSVEVFDLNSDSNIAW